eukprot:CAMPEP_0185796838 /NCGR_PEP_ID=MMETSP1174-20130828/161298_1 /TAXON_ID=35687 /ORGANISM="Dictyocha speculum, Strain CCMP1381" /LENGTH=192 /DNA_ID=CAMNT_0028492231 /DNA_START=12 /DNA_END=590 /DNA_ORIENTATION=-
MSWASAASAAASIPEPVSNSVPNRTTRSSRGSNHPEGEAEACFVAAVQRVFARWSLLRLAIDMGWGDGNGQQNVQEMMEKSLTMMQKKRNVDADALEDMFMSFISDRFHVVAEDGSPREVSQLLTTLHKQCATGDLALAQQILAQPIPAAGEGAAKCVEDMQETGSFNGSDSEDEDMTDAPMAVTVGGGGRW